MLIHIVETKKKSVMGLLIRLIQLSTNLLTLIQQINTHLLI